MSALDLPVPAQETAASAVDDGRLISFGAYLTAAGRARLLPTHWPSRDIAVARSRYPQGERGTVALVPGDGGDSAEAAPGVSLTIQIVEPIRDTRAHRHAFWHLYIVVSGHGIAHVDDTLTYTLAPGDAFYVPPWTAHHMSNPHGDESLVLYALQNLPQLAALGTLMREAPDGGIEHVYRAPSDLPAAS